MPDEKDLADAKPEAQKQTLGKVPLDCIMLAQEIKHLSHAPLGLFATYCFDRNLDSLRLVYDFGSQLTIRNHIGTFQQRNVAIDLATSLDSVNAITGHIEALQTVALTEADFVPPSDFEKVEVNAVTAGSGVIQGLILKQPRPHYPESARHNHVSGTVLIAARIGRDGRVHSMKLTSAPDPDLAVAALAAVRQWTYKPYLLDGEPTEVQTTITVHFKFGPL